MKKLIVAVSLLTALSAAPAHAVIFQYYEGNNCTQNKLGAADAESLKAQNREALSWNLKGQVPGVALVIKIFAPIAAWSLTDTYNDEIRSVRILSNWHTVRESRNPTFTVYDDPKGGTSDDWAKIYVSDATLLPDEGVCIGSFEKPFNKYGVRLELHPVNGLDGKISHLAIACDAACRNNLTPDPNPPKKREPIIVGAPGTMTKKTTRVPLGTIPQKKTK